MNRKELEHLNHFNRNHRKNNNYNNNGRNYLLIIICTLLFYYGCYSSAATYVNRQLNVQTVQGIAGMSPMICFSGVGEDPFDRVNKDFTKYLSSGEIRNRLKAKNYRLTFRFL